MQDKLYLNYKTLLVNYIQDHKSLLAQYGATEVNFAANEKVLRQDAPKTGVYFLQNGLVKVVRNTTVGQPYTLGVFGRGEIIGDAEALMDINHFCTVQTLTPCYFLKIGPEHFLKLLTEVPAFNLLVHQSTTFKLLNTSQKASVQSTNKLYYSLLLILRELAGFTDLIISKSLLTEFLGTSLRNINRLLPPLANKNIIKLQSSIITHIQLPELEKGIKNYELALH